MTTTPRALLRRLCVVLLALLAACGSYEDKRIRELLHEKGFGSRATGDATRENYIGGLDGVQFLLDPAYLVIPNAERLAELTVGQPVAIDGTIHVPYVGPVYVLGKTESEVAALVRSELRAVFRFDIPLEARIVGGGKFFYAIGETGAKGPIQLQPDMTLIDAMFQARWTPVANIGRVYLIRPDAEHPLVIDVNLREMLTTGYTAANFQIRERDIIYVPPTFLGMVARLLQRLFEPIGYAVRSMLGLAQAQLAYNVLQGSSNSLYGFNFRF